MILTKRAFLMSTAGLFVATSALAKSKPEEAPTIAFSEWQDDEPQYLFYPSDKLEIQIGSAPELNRAVTVAQDGRIALPLIGQVMAAFKSAPELALEITELYRPHVRRPEAQVFAVETGNTRVLVGGEVRAPGWVEAPGDFDALSAVLAAGGFTNGAKSKKVVLIRRGPDGIAMQKIIDLKSLIKGQGGTFVALRRYDIIYVPRTSVAEAGVWVEQHINNLIPSGIMTYLLYNSGN